MVLCPEHNQFGIVFVGDRAYHSRRAANADIETPNEWIWQGRAQDVRQSVARHPDDSLIQFGYRNRVMIWASCNPELRRRMCKVTFDLCRFGDPVCNICSPNSFGTIIHSSDNGFPRHWIASFYLVLALGACSSHSASCFAFSKITCVGIHVF